MEYHEAADFLFDLRRYSPRTGVESTRRLLEHLGNPGADLRIVQVAGSNGKGSTARLTERVLREAGLDVGLFTSPHLDDLRERVSIDGRPVTKRAVCEYVEAIEDYAVAAAADGESPTFFEAVTALGLWAFARADVDVAILEVGIGGRYDATSAVAPNAAAVTSVALEHTDVLGDSVPEIARDKAAVAPADAPLVTAAEGAALEAVLTTADEVIRVGTGSDEGETGRADPDAGDDASGVDPAAGGTGDEEDPGAPDPDSPEPDAEDQDTRAVEDRLGPPDVEVIDLGREGLEQALRLAGDGWDVETRIPLLGRHQVRNAGVAAALARQVADVPASAIARGLRNAHWPGRFEVMDRSPLVVLDGAHNPGGCGCLAETLSTFEYDGLHLVVGAMADKDHAGMVAALPAADRAYACAPALDRAEEPATIAAALRADDRAGDVLEVGAVAEAVAAAIGAADDGDAVVVAGSLYTVAEARRRWSRVAVPTRVRDLETAGERLSAADVSGADVDRTRGAGVHRVVRTRVRPGHARALREELRSIGGECAVSALLEHDEELADVVLMGTVSEFARLAAALGDRSDGLGRVATQLRAAVGVTDGPDGAVKPGPDVESRGTDPSGRGADAGTYPWTDGTAVMGILNVTPDSFHDGGRYEAVEDAVDGAERMVAEGADVVDVGGESTRPGAAPIGPADEIDRVVPVVERVAELDALVSVDTRKAAVARAALEAGADLLNDVSGLADPEMRLVAAEHDVPVVVMHSVETPVDPDRRVEYDEVVTDVLEALRERVLLAERAGLDRSQILVDPGLGFGKTSTESFELLGRIEEFRALGCPVLVGHSRKSMFERVESESSDDRLAASVAASALAADRGADVVRVHDVAETVAAVNTVAATNDPRGFDGR